MDSERLKVVQQRLSQKDKHKLRSFLGLCIYYWRFIAGFADSEVADPIQGRKAHFSMVPRSRSCLLNHEVMYSTCPRILVLEAR